MADTLNEKRVHSLGICLGASTISMVEIEQQGDGKSIIQKVSRPHLGNVRDCLNQLLQEVGNLETLHICVTGRKYRHSLNLSSISEPEAVELAARHILPYDHPFRLVISAGGETFMVYHLDQQGYIQNIHTGNKCASGTGDFYLQQLRRMDIPLAKTANMDFTEKPFNISGRCSVFCKSDCTHALNKGVAKSAVVTGLTRMMADKIGELINKTETRQVLLIGGCTSNQGMVHYLLKKVEQLHIPQEAPYFEALGAALWALANKSQSYPGLTDLFRDNISQFSFHQPLENFQHLIHYKTRPHGKARPGDQTILGLDVGSTTTKGVLLRRSDKVVLASSYLRTNGDPIQASKNVYTSLDSQIQVPIEIEAVGVTGSGRQIAGLHALTPNIINEIIAHATAAAFYDQQVDTIFEIGGQDAKYTFLTNGVPNDYAMNEACSAGTGSFLEEASKESLGLEVTEIGDVAFRGKKPLNFSDQCAAFISSDIKNAVQHHVPSEDIVAGLVYSIGMNFINRVKGNRPVGKRIFIQGGVCYNKAVPVAIAALTGKEVTVPPDPGLIGAFGVALEVEKRIKQGLIETGSFHLPLLAAREITYDKSFTCRGDAEKCDRKCEIARIIIDEKTYPFGGICNRYDNIVRNSRHNVGGLDLVEARQRLVFAEEASADVTKGPSIRMNRSFLINTYYPFYHRFFAELGYRLVLPKVIEPAGIAQRGAQFCYPAEIAHGYLADMLSKPADFTFLPHLKGFPSGDNETSCACIFVQSEPFYLKSTFKALDTPKTLSPTIDFTDNFDKLQKVFSGVAVSIGGTKAQGRKAFVEATAAQNRCQLQLKERGRQILKELEENPAETAIVLFGRPYNSFAGEANKGISRKFSSRGIKIIPFDMLDYEAEKLEDGQNMFWAMGNILLRCARLVARHPQLFAAFITNFSCGPDSFIITYFRDIMGDKPSLTLELDSHTVDAGIETRIEAFLDIISSYRGMTKEYPPPLTAQTEIFNDVEYNGNEGIVRVNGDLIPLTDKRVRLLLPSMGRFGSSLVARAFSRIGINAEVLAPANAETLKLGRGNSSCKECLPLQTTIGSILDYLQNKRPAEEITVYLMPSAPGPCRFGQYNVFTRRLMGKLDLPNITVFSPSSKNCYGGLGTKFYLAAWRAIVVGDIFDEMWSTIMTIAADKEDALRLLDDNHAAISETIDKSWRTFTRQLQKCAAELGTLTLNKKYEDVPKITLAGEIYVRHDPLSLQNLVEKMAARGFIIRTAQNSEWIKYLDWLIKNNILGKKSATFQLVHWLKEKIDSRIREILAPTGLFHHADMRVKHVVELGARYISPQLRGEAILTVGTAFHDILNPSCGIISVGPFGCMPNRVAEAILQEKFTTSEKRVQLNGKAFSPIFQQEDSKFPLLVIETDGGPFPQVIEARLEAFCLQADRLHQKILDTR